jgi:hypothetical protein
MREINLIWCVKSQYEVDFSFKWINEIFSEFEINHYYDIDNNFDKFIDNSILTVCVNKNPNTRLIEYINKYNEKELNYTILHLSDEAFEQNIDFYSVSKKILRNYYKKEYVDKYNILTIPLGYQSGIEHVTTQKIYDVNFIGQIKSDRHEMLSIFNNISNKYFYLTRMWGDPNGLNTSQFSEVLSQSNFTLCPRGWISLDSFRINEALECSSIPVSILEHDGTDYFEKIYGEHPFIIGNDWNDAYLKMISCKTTEKIEEVNNWWTNFKQSLKIKIKNYVDEE